MSYTLINGIKASHIPVNDRGLHYGDGLFETIACNSARPQFLAQHLERMQQDAKWLQITFPGKQVFYQDINTALAATRLSRCVIKLMLTRGQGKRGYAHDNSLRPTRICQLSEWPQHVDDWKQTGIKATFCNTQASSNSQLAGIKHLNRLENVLASGELGSEYQEGFLSDANGHVIEGTQSNLFVVTGNKLLTPDLSSAGIAGIMRDQILSIADENKIPVEICNIDKQQLQQADEIFISNSIIGLCRIRQLDEQPFQSDNMYRLINTALQKRIEADAETAA